MTLTLKIIEEIISLHNQRIPRIEISKTLNITPNQVKYILDQRNGGLEKKKLRTIEKKIKEMYLSGHTRKQISEVIGWKDDRIKTFLYRNKIKKRILVSSEVEEKIVSFWKEKISIGKIAVKVSLSKGVVDYILRKKGLI